jgi:hypothetical protein
MKRTVRSARSITAFSGIVSGESFSFSVSNIHYAIPILPFSPLSQNVGGPSSSFGIWHEQKDQVKAIAAKYGITVVRIHTHIGSGSDPAVWQSVTGMSLKLVEDFPQAGVLNLGGGYKVQLHVLYVMFVCMYVRMYCMDGCTV